MKVIENFKKIKELYKIEVPYEVWTTFYENKKEVYIYGDQIDLGCDFKSLEECRDSVAWFVDQLGGTVKWSKK